jgi:biopolymer transport protein TolR
MPAVTERAQIGRRRRARPLSEINVTPFVDVMLVLLIVCMVTAPLLTVGVPVDLPKTKAQPLSQDREPLTLSVRRDGSIYLQNTRISEDDLIPRLTAIAANGYDQRVFVRGDKAVDYGHVMQVMALVSAAGFTHIGLVTDVARPPSENDRNKK